MKISVIGAATTKFGELWGISPRSLARSAANDAIRDAEIEKEQIEALFVGNMLSGILGMQEHLGAFFAEELGLIGKPACKVEGACASGGLAVHNAYNSILAGQYETVMVLGIEKMTDHKPENIASALMGAGSESERLSGTTFPGLYAILAHAHMAKYGTKSSDLANVAVKNHYHGLLNPKAQFQSSLTVEKALSSTCIADPLRLFDCSPVSDGASALILTSRKKANGVDISASCVATDTLGLADRKSLTELSATKLAAKSAFRKSGILPSDIDVAEVHDCFTIAEILAMEDIGFYKKGEAAAAITRQETILGKSKKLVVNTSGGLKACGHPVGATGVKQVVEVVDQIRNRCDKRQVNKVRCGLTQNVGGSGATAVIHILKVA